MFDTPLIPIGCVTLQEWCQNRGRCRNPELNLRCQGIVCNSLVMQTSTRICKVIFSHFCNCLAIANYRALGLTHPHCVAWEVAVVISSGLYVVRPSVMKKAMLLCLHYRTVLTFVLPFSDGGAKIVYGRPVGWGQWWDLSMPCIANCCKWVIILLIGTHMISLLSMPLHFAQTGRYLWFLMNWQQAGCRSIRVVKNMMSGVKGTPYRTKPNYSFLLFGGHL